jgi:heme A synthase
VKYNAPLGPELKLFHGLFSQIALAGMVGVALLTSRAGQRTAPAVPELRRLSVAVMLILYLQIAFGGVVRHFLHPHAQRAHVLFAFVAAGAVLWLVRSVWEKTTDASVRRGAGLLAGLVVVQLALGVEAWLGRFGAGVSPLLVGPNFYVDAVRTGHFVVGAALFQTAVALTLLLYRPETAAVVARVRTADVVETNRPAGLEWGGVA